MPRKKAEEKEEVVAPVERPSEFDQIVQGLRDRIAGMQLRPSDTQAFNEDLDRLVAAR